MRATLQLHDTPSASGCPAAAAAAASFFPPPDELPPPRLLGLFCLGWPMLQTTLQAALRSLRPADSVTLACCGRKRQDVQSCQARPRRSSAAATDDKRATGYTPLLLRVLARDTCRTCALLVLSLLIVMNCCIYSCSCCEKRQRIAAAECR